MKRTQRQRQSFVDFCSEVLALTLTDAQRILAAVAIDGVQPSRLSGSDREIARQLFGDVDDVPPTARRVQAWSLGRGSGKTTLAAALMVYAAVTGDLRRVGPGMTPAAVALAPRTSTAKLAVSVARALVRAAPALERMVASDDDAKEGFSLVRGGRRVRIAAFAASKGGVNVRGFDLLLLVLDEAEFFQSDSDAAVTDRDSFNAAVPRLLHGPTHHALFISTPWPVPTLMGELHTKNFGRPSTALAASGASLFMRDNDSELAAEIEVERANDPENTARERDCDRDAVGASNFFDAHSVDAAVDSSLVVPSRPTGSRVGLHFGAGADLGLIKDSSALVVVEHSEDEQIVARVVHELRPKKGEPLKLSAVIASFASTLAPFGVRRFFADGHAREPAREWADMHKLKIASAPTAQAAKFASYLTLQKALREQRIALPSNTPRLIAQLKATVAKPTAGGNMQIVAPRRAGLAHGDLVSSLVLAVYACDARLRESVSTRSAVGCFGGGSSGDAPTFPSATEFFGGRGDAYGSGPAETPLPALSAALANDFLGGTRR